jgi:hypothetical protein
MATIAGRCLSGQKGEGDARSQAPVGVEGGDGGA